MTPVGPWNRTHSEVVIGDGRSSMAGEQRKYSCQIATETLEWIRAIIDFLAPYSFFFHAHVVNFFKDRLWEAVDTEWMDCLRNEPVENLLLIPSGVAQDYWPASLKEFILKLSSLTLCREQADLQRVLPDLRMTAINNVLSQGMNWKKKHEVEALAAVIDSIARSVGAHTIVDVGAGQGYLAQVLSFEYQHQVIAVDASSHHGRITNARAERIRKYYEAKLRKSGSEDMNLNIPQTITSNVLSTATLKSLTKSLIRKDDVEQRTMIIPGIVEFPQERHCERKSSCYADNESPLVLAGLHACGDLSVTMLRTFLECKEVKAVVSIGCCYNMLSEEEVEHCGFPMSKGVKYSGLSLGRNSRDLACQSAERWKGLGKDAGLHNFELHAFRAAFQMVLFRYCPEILVRGPAIGRQGKALRRQQCRRILESNLQDEDKKHFPLSLSQENCKKKEKRPTMNSTETRPVNIGTCEILLSDTCNSTLESCGAADFPNSAVDVNALSCGLPSDQSSEFDCEEIKSVDKYSLFEKFSYAGLNRLGLQNLLDIDLAGSWKECEPFSDLIGPYWSLRAALGPVLETIILLDRLLFLQEQGNSVAAVMLPIFNPALSPRNVALIGIKNSLYMRITQES